MERMIQITESQAYSIKRLLEDIGDINSRARCSDKFFRSHFMDLAKTANAMGVYAQLVRALESEVK